MREPIPVRNLCERTSPLMDYLSCTCSISGGVSLRLFLDLATDCADPLHREADLVIRMLRPTQSRLIARKLGSVPLGLFAHNAYLKGSAALT